MANTTMGLTEAEVEFGRRLWHELGAKNSPFPIRGMWWLFEGEWHLVIASEIADKLGSRDAFRELDRKVQMAPSEASLFSKIEMIGTKHPLYQGLSSVFAQTASVEGARLGGSHVGRVYVEDAYLYGVR